MAATASYCSSGAPAFAEPAPQPPAPKVTAPEPKLLPLQPGEVIIRDPDGFDQQWKYSRPPNPNKDLKAYLKDPFTWA
jgi:hypothetical protein